jgi:[ribosomal protein S5]-alanine N-acetyltransferase
MRDWPHEEVRTWHHGGAAKGERERGGQVKAPTRIDTPRLSLVQPASSDARAIFERYASDPEVTRFLGWPHHRAIEDTLAFLAFSDAEWERWPAGPYLIRASEDGRLLGSTGLAFESAREASTGYVLAKDAWGRGFATEALRAMVDVARRAGVARLRALCHAQHRASWHVLEKCGFARDTAWVQHTEFPNLAPGALQETLRYTIVLEPPAPGSA